MATCETNGHLFGPNETCIMCGAKRVIQPVVSFDAAQSIAKAMMERMVVAVNNAQLDMLTGGVGFLRITAEGIEHVPAEDVVVRVKDDDASR